MMSMGYTDSLSLIFSAVFFKGQIEHPDSGGFRLRDLHDDQVYVAINPDGIFIIDMDDVVSAAGTKTLIGFWEYENLFCETKNVVTQKSKLNILIAFNKLSPSTVQTLYNSGNIRS